MTERKPPGMGFESWVDQQIRKAEDRGEFSNAPGFGKPLPALDAPYQENWWLAAKLRSENLSFPLPPILALRKEASDVLEEIKGFRSEYQVRRILTEINQKITEALAKPAEVPLKLTPFDVEQVVSEWRANRDG